MDAFRSGFQDTAGRAVLSQPMPGAGRVHQRVAVVRRRGALPVGLRRVICVLHASVVHAPGVQHRVDCGHNHRGRVVRADRVVVPQVPVAISTVRVRRPGGPVGLQADGRGHRGRHRHLRRHLLT